MLKSIKIKKIISITLAAIMMLSIGCLSTSAEELKDTASRGYQLIDGDVYDLDGNLLIKLYNGVTADGYALDPNFTVYDAEDLDDRDGITTLAASDIYDGTKYLYKNTDGNQGVQLGSNFTLTSSKSNVYLGYDSGEPSGVNFAVLNVTRDTVVQWISNIKAEKSKSISVYNSSRPDDTYSVKASAVDVSGNATLQVGKE
jgi:hypothetical protein